MYLAADLVAPGGPSAPVWGLLGLIVIALGGIFRELIKAKSAANEAKVKASQAAENAKQARENTASLGNGFSKDVLDRLGRLQGSIDNHLEWHLDREGK